jgi:catechol 2,3-dioxygenase-like lactoylglutathione lyase family enzyme
MVIPTGLSHVAMSVPEGTLTDEYRAELLGFYGDVLGWREIESQRLPDRLTISVGAHAYLNLRERADAMVCFGYEHLGIVVDSVDEAERLWTVLDADGRDLHLEPLSRGAHGLTTFRFRHLLPLAVEVQAFS